MQLEDVERLEAAMARHEKACEAHYVAKHGGRGYRAACDEFREARGEFEDLLDDLLPALLALAREALERRNADAD